MNAKFSEATTSIAFALTLSKRQCNSLLRLLDEKQTNMERLWICSVDGLRPLERKGLVFWHHDESGNACGFGGMTPAGRLVAQLLIEAGLTIENTNTSLVNKRIERLKERSQ